MAYLIRPTALRAKWFITTNHKQSKKAGGVILFYSEPYYSQSLLPRNRNIELQLQCNYTNMMNSLTFEWDENKNNSNQKKHNGVSFEEAQTVFSDELGRLVPDPEHSEGEDRFILMGMSTQFRILTVCHCEIHEDAIRIISARKADKNEIKQYEGYHHA